MIKSGDLNCVSSMVQHLRNICNHSDSLVYPPSEPSFFSRTPSDVSPEPPRALSRLLQVSPLDSVSMDNMNLVFLKQELSTTGRLIIQSVNKTFSVLIGKNTFINQYRDVYF